MPSSTGRRRRRTRCLSVSCPKLVDRDQRIPGDVIEVGRRTRPQPYGMFGVRAHHSARTPFGSHGTGRRGRAHRHAFGRRRTPRRRRVAPSDGVRIRCRSLSARLRQSRARGARRRNPSGDMAKRLCDGRTRTLSEYREYERGVTAAVNAAVRSDLIDISTDCKANSATRICPGPARHER